MKIPFNKPSMVGNELTYIREAINQHRHLSGNGPLTHRCESMVSDMTGCGRAMLTHSCTAALEMSALLAGLGPGDEVIMPSYTFVSTANAFALRGAVPVFVDVRSDTLNIDERQIESAITARTKAICVVHYAGVGCEMDDIVELANRRGLLVIEDAAQGVMARYKGRPLGAIGDLGAFSFHETKNISSGEGGALLVNNAEFTSRAEILRDKGTDRARFFEGLVDKYTWQDLGSSFLPSDLVAAFLLGQLERSAELTNMRVQAWTRYHGALHELEADGLLRRPQVPQHCEHNAHMYYVMLPTMEIRQRTLSALRERGIAAVFHFVPLHQSPAGRRYCRKSGSLKTTEDVAVRILRLPMWNDIEVEQIDTVVDTLTKILRHK